MSKPSRKCPKCGKRMKQQFIGLYHCKCGISYCKNMDYFERTEEMVFVLERRKVGKKVKRVPTIRYKNP